MTLHLFSANMTTEFIIELRLYFFMQVPRTLEVRGTVNRIRLYGRCNHTCRLRIRLQQVAHAYHGYEAEQK